MVWNQYFLKSEIIPQNCLPNKSQITTSHSLHLFSHILPDCCLVEDGESFLKFLAPSYGMYGDVSQFDAPAGIAMFLIASQGVAVSSDTTGALTVLKSER